MQMMGYLQGNKLNSLVSKLWIITLELSTN